MSMNLPPSIISTLGNSDDAFTARQRYGSFRTRSQSGMLSEQERGRSTLYAPSTSTLSKQSPDNSSSARTNYLHRLSVDDGESFPPPASTAVIDFAPRHRETVSREPAGTQGTGEELDAGKQSKLKELYESYITLACRPERTVQEHRDYLIHRGKIRKGLEGLTEYQLHVERGIFIAVTRGEVHRGLYALDKATRDFDMMAGLLDHVRCMGVDGE